MSSPSTSSGVREELERVIDSARKLCETEAGKVSPTSRLGPEAVILDWAPAKARSPALMGAPFASNAKEALSSAQIETSVCNRRGGVTELLQIIHRH
jgi:hypothetical protein